MPAFFSHQETRVTPFFEGVLAGYGIAVPVGAIAVLIIETALRGGWRAGAAAGAGAASADVLYAALAALAGQVLSAWLAPWAVVLRCLSALVLLGLGGWGVWRAWRLAPATPAPQPVTGRDLGAIFAKFVALTVLNPLTVVYFTALMLGSGTASLLTAADRAWFVVGAGLASLSWQWLLAGVGAWAHTRLPARAQRWASLLGNGLVLVLGVRLLVWA